MVGVVANCHQRMVELQRDRVYTMNPLVDSDVFEDVVQSLTDCKELLMS